MSSEGTGERDRRLQVSFLCENVEVNDRFGVNPALKKMFLKIDFAARQLTFEFENPSAKELIKFKLTGDMPEISQIDLSTADNSIRVELAAFSVARYVAEGSGLMHQWRKSALSDIVEDIDDELSHISLTAILALDITGKALASRNDIVDRLCNYPKRCTVDGRVYTKSPVVQASDPQRFDTGTVYCPSKNEYVPNPTQKESQEEQAGYGEEKIFEEAVNDKDFKAIEQDINSKLC